MNPYMRFFNGFFTKYPLIEGLPADCLTGNFELFIQLKFPIMKFIYTPMAKRFIPILFILLSGIAVKAQIHYVHISAAGSGDGSSWVDAITDVQVAIDAATPGDSIFVAEGTYLPTYRHLGDSLRNSTFYLNKTLHLFGGFSGEAGTVKKLGKGQDHCTFNVAGFSSGTYLISFYHDGKNGVKKISVQ